MIITTGFADLSAESHRNQTASLLATTATLDPLGTPQGLQVYGGIHSGFNLAKTGPLAGTIAAGRAVIPDSDPEQGAYVVTMTEPEPFYIDPGDGTYNRRDLVCLKIDEEPPPPEEGDPEPPAVAGASIVVVKGTGVTGATVPATPAAPTNAIPLWSIYVGASTSEGSGGFPITGSNLVDLRLRLKLANQDRQPFAMAAGWMPVTCNGTLGVASAGISFPTGRFRTAPIVMATIQTAPNGTQRSIPRVINVTPTGASIYIYTGDGADFGVNHSVTVAWTAIQMAEDKSNG